MSSDRKLFAILFADVVGYTALMHADEQSAMTVLNRFKAQTQEYIDHHNGHIWQFYGDGCLATFENASDAVDCSIRMQESFRVPPSVKVRIGLHLGEVIASEDNIHGDSVNIASRIESMGIPFGIMMSRVIVDQIKNKPIYQLQSMGNFDFKNIDEPLEVFALANEGFPVPNASQLHGKFDEQKIQKRKRRKMLSVSGIAAVAILVVVAWLVKSNKSFSGSKDDKTTLAVFPFQDLSNDGAYREYAILIRRGIYENLSRIGQIRLLSLSGIAEKDEDLPSNTEIASRVNLDRYVSGNILALDDDTRTVQSELVEPESHEAIWVNSYEHVPGQDIFSIVNPITETILSEIGVVIEPQNQNKIKRVPTSSSKAYGNVKKAIELTELRDRESLSQAVDLLVEAIRLDNKYAEAYAELGNTLFAQGWRNYIDRDSAFREGEILAKRAIALYDQVNTANSVLATYAEVVEKDKDKARNLYERAIDVVPNDPTAHRHFSTFLKRNREYTAALQYARNAAELSPLNVIINRNYIDLMIYNELLEDAQTHLDELKNSMPERLSRFADFQGDILSMRGKYAEAIPFYEERLKVSKSVSGQLGFCYAQTGQLDQARNMIDTVPQTTYEYVNKAMIYVGMSTRDDVYEDSLFKYIDLVIETDRGVNFLCDHPFFDPVPIPVCDE